MSNVGIVHRICKRILVNEETGCWEWQGCHNGEGYGQIGVSRKLRSVHRVMYEAFYGEIPKGLFCCHHCDNPGCCNPDHLFLGTPQDNKRDAMAKERHAAGERHGLAVLTEYTVREIRRRYSVGGVRQADLAQEFGVTQQGIAKALSGQTWPHLSVSSSGDK